MKRGTRNSSRFFVAAVIAALATLALGAATAAARTDPFQLAPSVHAEAVTTGPDKDLWFAGYRGGTLEEPEPREAIVGTVAGAGKVVELHTHIGGLPSGIATGSDGALWVTLADAPEILRVATSGLVTSFALPAPAETGAAGIAAGPDGALWFVQPAFDRVGRTTAHLNCCLMSCMRRANKTHA